MEASSTPTPPPIATATATAEPMSLGARLVNIFVTPGEVFEAIKSAPFTLTNWLVPAFLATLIGLIFVFTLFTQEAFLYQMREQQSKALQKQVEAGKMTQEQVRQAEQVMEKMGPWIMRIGGSIGVIANSLISPVFWGFILWMFSRLMRKEIPFNKAVEVAGIAAMIQVLGGIVAFLLSMIMGRLGSLNLALFLKEFDMSDKAHISLSAVNVFYLWYTALLAIGFAKLADVPLAKAAGYVFVFWILSRVFAIATGLGQFVL